MPLLEAFLSQHPWWTLLLGMALSLVVILLVGAWSMLARRRAPSLPTTSSPPDRWQRIAARVSADLRVTQPYHPDRLVISFLASCSLLSDTGDLLRVEAKWSDVHYLSFWQHSHQTLLARALASEGRAGVPVRFEVTVAPGVVWSWTPTLIRDDAAHPAVNDPGDGQVSGPSPFE